MSLRPHMPKIRFLGPIVWPVAWLQTDRKVKTEDLILFQALGVSPFSL